jgi:hypothetical protein
VIYYDLFDALDERGVNIIEGWMRLLETSDRAKLNQKLDMLQRFEFEQMRGTNVLHGPINKTKHIYKIRVQSNIAMRPLVCRGPIVNLKEYTLLQGAFEKDYILPRSEIKRAEANRLAIIASPDSRRKKHVRIP